MIFQVVQEIALAQQLVCVMQRPPYHSIPWAAIRFALHIRGALTGRMTGDVSDRIPRLWGELFAKPPQTRPLLWFLRL